VIEGVLAARKYYEYVNDVATWEEGQKSSDKFQQWDVLGYRPRLALIKVDGALDLVYHD